MGRVTTFANGGKIFPADINLIQDDYENAFAARRVLARGTAQIGGNSNPGNVLLPWASNVGGTANMQTPGAAPAEVYSIYFDPATLPGGARAIKLRLRAVVFCGQVAAPAVNFTFRLMQLANGAVQSSAGNPLAISTFAGATALGTDGVLNTPAASSVTQVVTGDATVSTAGLIVVQFFTSGFTAASSYTSMQHALEARLV